MSLRITFTSSAAGGPLRRIAKCARITSWELPGSKLLGASLCIASFGLVSGEVRAQGQPPGQAPPGQVPQERAPQQAPADTAPAPEPPPPTVPKEQTPEAPAEPPPPSAPGADAPAPSGAAPPPATTPVPHGSPSEPPTAQYPEESSAAPREQPAAAAPPAPVPTPPPAPGPVPTYPQPPVERDAGAHPLIGADEFRLQSNPEWGVGLIGYAGIAALWTRGDERAHGLVGGMLRGRWSYFQAGAQIETTDRSDEIGLKEKWVSYGGFAGVFLPYFDWVDFDFAVGLSNRQYTNPDPRYGTGGYDLSAPSLTLRAGVSDRIGTRGLMRIGGSIAAAIDLGRNTAPWVYAIRDADGEEDELTGETAVGGTSVGLALTLGFEVAPPSE